MKQIWFLIAAILFILSGCTQQENKLQNTELSNDKDAPIEDIVVKKEYDEDGNIIRYDSTYSSFYSNIKDDKFAEDSILKDFKSMFEKKYPFSYNPSFNDFLYRDSLMKYDFYKKDFFSNRFNQNKERIDKMLEEMDSVKNKFFDEQFPPHQKE
ncbi:MAG TPA: hypothetical protein VFC69_03365 [Dysgonamonadaceae bacterium]|nr:hypothetical protein [Dysgonamonadaceae bacterium]